MRHTVWILLALAGNGGAQWRHFGATSFPATEMLARHNSLRATVGVAPLAWSDRLSALSQDWANSLLKRRQFAHRPNSAAGENLFEITGAAASPEQVVNAWAGESRNYDRGSNTCRGSPFLLFDSGQFTEVP